MRRSRSFRPAYWLLPIFFTTLGIGISLLSAQDSANKTAPKDDSTKNVANDPPKLVICSPVFFQADLSQSQSFVGTVQAPRRSIVGSAVDARVTEYLVQEGDRVEKGQTLAQLLTGTLEIQLAALEADRDLRKHELEELQNGSRPEEKKEAEGRMAAAKAAMEYAQAKLQRTQALAEKNIASEDQLQDDRSSSLQAENLYVSAQATRDLVLAGPRAEKIQQAKARLAMAEQQVLQIQDQIEKHTIRAPFHGYVVKEYSEVGNWIKRGDPVAEIVELDQVEIQVPVLENYVPQLRIGSPANVEVGALTGRIFPGEVSRIVSDGDPRSRAFPVRILIKNEILEDGQPLLRPGMFARASLPVGHEENVILVPKDAVVLGGAHPQIFVLQGPPDGTNIPIQVVDVELGLAQDGLLEIRSSKLKATDHVVVEGNERLRAGMRVNVTKVRQGEFHRSRPIAPTSTRPTGGSPTLPNANPSSKKES